MMVVNMADEIVTRLPIAWHGTYLRGWKSILAGRVEKMDRAKMGLPSSCTGQQTPSPAADSHDDEKASSHSRPRSVSLFTMLIPLLQNITSHFESQPENVRHRTRVQDGLEADGGAVCPLLWRVLMSPVSHSVSLIVTLLRHGRQSGRCHTHWWSRHIGAGGDSHQQGCLLRGSGGAGE